MLKYTKIVATVSDRRCDVDFIKSIWDAGVNVVRMNSAHINYEGFKRIVNNARTASDSIGIIMDTKGPEIRTTTTVNDEVIDCKKGRIVTIYGNPERLTTQTEISLNYSNISNVLKIGDRLLIDDGEIGFTVTDIKGNEVIAITENDGRLGSRKSVNLPGVSVDLPSDT